MHVDEMRASETHAEGLLLARPRLVEADAPSGLLPLGLNSRRDAYLYVPDGYSHRHPAPLVLMLHGAGGDGLNALNIFQPYADALGLILLAPDSRRQTWDVLYGNFGPDVAFIDQALQVTFSRYAVDGAQIGIEGFSDGASYALSLGLTNGTLFGDIIAFSPGFMAPGPAHGRPRIYISHGTGDDVLAIERTSRVIVPRLQKAGYDVTYEEFVGPHTVPPVIAQTALRSFLGNRHG
ncbi:MAG TPA: phospholipase [Chloroflexota bacterium]|nr:phospholipase [Chloroflexota bacterium]